MNSPFGSLKNRLFAQIYIAQTINLVGDSLTWVGLALLAYSIAGKESARILSIALTLRVTAFVIFSPFAGLLADKIDRKMILVGTHLARMILVGMLPFVTAAWQIYVIVFLLNIFYAFFTPTYKAVIPFIVPDKQEYPKAIALSSATTQLLGVVGPGAAGALAVWVGSRQIFFMDATTFFISAAILMALPVSLSSFNKEANTFKKWEEVKKGTAPLFKDNKLLTGLLMQLVMAIIGAQILVNSVVYIKGDLGLNDDKYGVVMTAYGLGATLSAFLVGLIKTERLRIWATLTGAFLAIVGLSSANFTAFIPLLALWSIVGFGQSLVNIPMQTLIADRTEKALHGRIYGAHFAWSHLWWAFAYPAAGLLAKLFPDFYFLTGSLSGLALFVLVLIFMLRRSAMRERLFD